MNARELYSTTMDPANRELIQLTTDDIEKTLALYNQLMGKHPSLRKEFIVKNRLSSFIDEDVYDDEDFDAE